MAWSEVKADCIGFSRQIYCPGAELCKGLGCGAYFGRQREGKGDENIVPFFDILFTFFYTISVCKNYLRIY